MKQNILTLFLGTFLGGLSCLIQGMERNSPLLSKSPLSHWITVLPGQAIFAQEVGSKLIYSNPNLYPNLALPQGLFFWKNDQTVRPVSIKNKKIIRGDQYVYDPRSQLYRHSYSNAPYKPSNHADPSPAVAVVRKQREEALHKQYRIKAALASSKNIRQPKQSVPVMRSPAKSPQIAPPARPTPSKATISAPAPRLSPKPHPIKPIRPAVPHIPSKPKIPLKVITPALPKRTPPVSNAPVAIKAQQVIPATASSNISLAKQVLEYTNQFRKSRGLPALQWHQGVADQAYIHSMNMGTKKVSFSHEGFKERAGKLRTRAAAENIFMCNMRGDIAKIAVDGWIRSPGHHKNLIGNYTHCGIGVYQNNAGYWYVTQIFASF